MEVALRERDGAQGLVESLRNELNSLRRERLELLAAKDEAESKHRILKRDNSELQVGARYVLISKRYVILEICLDLKEMGEGIPLCGWGRIRHRVAHCEAIAGPALSPYHLYIIFSVPHH